MTFEQYWAVLLKRWKIVVVCFLLVGLGAYIGSKLMRPVYQSSALVLITANSTNASALNQTDYNSLLASDQLVQTEAWLATSVPVLSEVASHYAGLTPGQLAGEASANPKTNTQLFEIDVVDPSPTRAADLANDIAATLIKQRLLAIQQSSNQAQLQIQRNNATTHHYIDEVTAQIAALQAKGGNQGQLATLQNQLSDLQQRYEQGLTALALLELQQTQAQYGDFMQVAQAAQPTTNPVRPNVRLNTAGGLAVGLLLGMLLAMLYERLDRRVRTSEEVSGLLRWPVLATIWRADLSKREGLINPSNSDANIEPYRILRTNIGFSSLDKPLRSLIVTSAQLQEGKSAIAANLAIFMAKAGKNTLLIDADLRHPIQCSLFGLGVNKLGLSNAILALSAPDAKASSQFLTSTSPLRERPPSLIQSSLEPFVHPVGIPNLWVMPSGPLPPNPSELLASKAMQRFLSEVENSGVEIVIFDTPPILGLADTSILASKVDGALVVVDISRATKTKLARMKGLLTQTGVHILGCVANKQRYRKSDYDYSHYYHYRTEEQNGRNKHTGNGRISSPPDTPIPVASPFDQRGQPS